MTKLSIMAVGNPGIGKSTLLNYLAREVLFKSGCSLGEGLTYQLDIMTNPTGTYIDTPGVADKSKRKEAGEAISTALKAGGVYKILFVIGNNDGRFIEQDLTTMRLVLEAAPEMKNHYGIIVNKVAPEIAEMVKFNAEVGAKLLTFLFSGIPDDRRCAQSSITYVLANQNYAAKNNLLIEEGKLCTLTGLSLEQFVDEQVPIVKLTKDKASDIPIQDFDAIAEEVQIMKKKMIEDQQYFKTKQQELEGHLMNAELEKAEILRSTQEQIASERERHEEKFSLVDDHSKFLQDELRAARKRPCSIM